MSAALQEKLKSTEVSPFIGSRVHLSKDDLLSGEFANDLRELLEQRGVLIFPEINFNDDEQVRFTKTLGELAPERAGELIYKVTLDTKVNSQADYLKGSLYWHLDGTMNEVPILASILTAKALAPVGGDTDFCNTYAAWENLPEEDKQLLEGLQAEHSAWNSLFYYDPEPSLEHAKQMMSIGEQVLPMVWKHSSGRKSLVLGCTARHVLGMGSRESAELLVRMREWATQPKFSYRHKWTLGDCVIWDNTGTMHRATPYDPNSGRMMIRTKLQGEEPFSS
ncbi:TauD/TfdA family dioxygenase [Ketobacter sp. MCCC 1A13808]|uniref:TauD/TfdA dioxygenase family protein n=1 Tax=Ketobacter sp. MCCC 1A13808 TaxID=2602738 RepID=UPI0012EBAA31|nr:TauD/TfdA family dioxygenase [Ketobacter sp. MCCC 1A13808]MVF13552.1 TauD/TfdA family dioxygenase [Ketobacter sp. MCCC 1A13808]